ncbi:thioredoxin fold domain-containing protein [Hyperthermus butylicus]|uniref:Cytochrome c biogenesis protein n=1 Tax=Hyperthermus butylicus (strain DSM 5456 / JCM 9403 / PLM1-5) TaxID=415426 RepID=A2BMX6_HYPBU|nr:thioredoxin fold domain-containing protein [Hyperthermus butylicus]ABM81337.1 Cytochrome c biogenesis protein [Hyperthermus butylicus DSM 5456]
MSGLRRRSMRLDLEGFQRRKRSGALLVVLVTISAVVVFSLLVYMEGDSKVYLKVSGNSIPNLAALEKLLEETEKPVAVMFEAPSCPVCRKMYPYWARLEEASSQLPVEFYHIMYSGESDPAFRRYGVSETPTFIVFVDGKPVARHVGGFWGGNITEAMLSWALSAAGLAVASNPERLASEGLQVFNSRCAVCHGHIEGIDTESLRVWLESRRAVAGDMLAERLVEALRSNRTLSELYGGYNLLHEAVAGMRKYVQDLTSYEVDRATYLLEYISAMLLGREPPRLFNDTLEAMAVEPGPGEATVISVTASGSQQLVGLVGALAAFAAGFVAAFSPCVLPLLVTQAAVVSSRGRVMSASSCGLCGLASFVGVLGIGALFVLFGAAVSRLQEVLIPVIASAVIAAGFGGLLGVPVELEGIISARRGGLIGFCAAYGFLAVQCNLPLVVGALLLIASAGSTVSALLVASSFALGVSVPLALALYTVSRLGAGVVDRLLARSSLLSRIGGAVLLASGLYLLMYSLQLV